MVKAIVGANWGDEGKGKITDLFAENCDIVVRFQGGSNAGHTIINQYGKFALHQLPSGIFNKNTLNIIANGVALNIKYLMEEIETVTSKDISFNLMISDRAQVLLPHHILLDVYEEERLGDKKFGSTKSGIAPFYADKFSKVGIQVWELYEKEHLKNKLENMYEKINVQFKHLYGKKEIDFLEVYNELLRYAKCIKKYIGDTSSYLRKAIKDDKKILLEGQLGALKDTDHGIYPYVTSSSTLAGYASVGAGIAPHSITEVLAITKAYSSAVGEGPFVTEIFGKEAEELRKRGGDNGEYGATTGRPRRVGYFDAVATRYGCEIQGATQVCITCIDVLSYLDEIKVCTGYKIGNEIYTDFLTTKRLYDVTPIYQILKGWKTDTRGITEYEELPQKAKEYIEFIEKQLGVTVTIISNGSKREEIIYK